MINTNYAKMDERSFCPADVYVSVGLCKIRFADIYGDHMVLQRAPRRAVLWGYADTIGDTVTVIKNGVFMGHTIVYRNTTGTVYMHSVPCLKIHVRVRH